MSDKFTKLFILIFSLVLGLSVQAKECAIEEALKDPSIYNNQQFWDDYAKLESTEDASAVGALLKKYGGKADYESPKNSGASANTASSSSKSLKFSMEKKAEKEIAHLPKELKGKVDDFVTSITKPGGILEVRNNPGRYHLERLSQFGDHAYSVRLNDGYRVLFDMDESNVVVRRVNKGQIHGN